MSTHLFSSWLPFFVAHAGSPDASGFLEGVLHPVFGPDHLVAIVCVGVLALRKPGVRLVQIPFAFVGMLLTGALAGLSGFLGDPPEVLLALSVTAVGLLLLFPARAGNLAVWTVVLVTAWFHGYAHGAESPAGGVFPFFLGFATGSALLLGAGLLLSLIFQELTRGEQLRRGVGALAGLAGLWFASALIF